MKKKKTKIGFSAAFSHPGQARSIHKKKVVLYLDESISHWLMSHGAMAYLIPPAAGAISVADLAEDLDALVLQGGVDVCPKTYGEEALHPDWIGDSKRDQYEMALVKQFMETGKPILGICRGAQLLNVALGGSLIQDIRTQNEKAILHRDGEIYDQLFHEIRFEPGSLLEELYGKEKTAHKVNSVHHQAVKKLGKGLKVEARAVDDHIIEAIRYDSNDQFIYGVQWHPEYQDPMDKTLLDPGPLLSHFLAVIEKRKA